MLPVISNFRPLFWLLNFNKLAEATLFRLSLCAEAQQMYHGNKSQFLKIFDPTLYLALTLKKDALILNFSEIVSSQVAFTITKTVNKFLDRIIK